MKKNNNLRKKFQKNKIKKNRRNQEIFLMIEKNKKAA